MGFKKVATLFLVLAVIPIAVAGCNGSATEYPDTTVSPDTTVPPHTTQPDWIKLSLSPVPKLGETAELTFTAKVSSLAIFRDNNNAWTWVEFSYVDLEGSYSQAKYGVPVPLDEVLISGDLSWEGNIFEEGLPELTATIQLPREGIWVITGYLSGEDRGKPLIEKEVRVLVTEDTAELMNTSEFESGPFGYLSYFRYGQFSSRRLPTEYDPVILELDISKIPLVGEETIVTCHIRSMVDVQNYFVTISFAKRPGDYPPIVFMSGDSFLVDGNLRWGGDLKKEEPTEFSLTVQFPENGNWQIIASGDCPTNDKLNFTDDMKMSISNDRQYFGWEKLPRRELSWYERIWQDLSCSPPPPTTISPYDRE
jgi:hypothetical protein